MRKIVLILLTIGLITFQSCEETQSVIYDGAPGSQTLVYFDGQSATLEVEINSTGSITVPIGVSNLSDSDRVVSISVDADNTTATAGQYSFNSSVTIPANSYTASFTVNGIDDNLTTTGVNLSLQIDDIDGGEAGTAANYVINIVEICPVEATFAVGNYRLEFVSGGIPAAGFSPPMGNNNTVNLRVGGSSTARVFNVKFYPAFGFANPPVDFSFNLVCATTTINGIVPPGVSGVGCGGSIAFGPNPVLGAYTVNDDSTLSFVVTEDVNEICGAAATTTYNLVKL